MEANASSGYAEGFYCRKANLGMEVLMNVLVTGHTGYIGAVLVPMLLEAKHEVTGLDTDFFAGCDFNGGLADVPAIRKDLRDVTAADLKGLRCSNSLGGSLERPTE